MIDTTSYTTLKTLREVAEQLKQRQIFGHKLNYFCNNYEPLDFCSFPDKKYCGADNFSKDIDINSPENKDFLVGKYYMDMSAAQGNNYFLGFDNGDYLYIDCFGDSSLTLWTTKDIKDNRCFGARNGFYLDKFFNEFMGATLVDANIQISESWQSDNGGEIYVCGDIRFVGELKLTFDNGKSLLFGAHSGMPYIKQLDQNDDVDVCNYWHIAKCYNIRDMYILGANIDEVNDILYQKFGALYTEDLKSKIASFNDYQLNKIWCYCLEIKNSKENVTIDDVKECVNWCETHPSIDFYDSKIVTYYAKYICDIINRRDMFNEDYLLSRINTIAGMQDVLDHIVQLDGCIKADEIKMYIENKTQV